MNTPKVDWVSDPLDPFRINAHVGGLDLSVRSHGDADATWSIDGVFDTTLREHNVGTRKRAIFRCEWIALALWKARRYDEMQKEAP